MRGVAWRVLAAAVSVTAVVAAVGSPALAQPRQPETAAASLDGTLKAVTCTGTDNCWAVGFHTSATSGGNPTAQLIEIWNGTAWQVVAAQAPPNSSAAALYGVACEQVTSCWAVGDYIGPNGVGIISYAEHWNGQAWRYWALPSPTPGTQNENQLFGVSCPEPKLCYAVGLYDTEQDTIASLVERWNGGSWTILPSPVLANATNTGLDDISCASARDCWAVGFWNNIPSAGLGGGLGEHWNGSQWYAVRIYHAERVGSVSCPALQMCLGLGFLYKGAARYAAQWNGTSWAEVPPIATTIADGLVGVSCATAQMCIAVGFTRGGPLAEQWNGSVWAVLPSPPNPSGAIASEFNNVTCPQVTGCWAVGEWQSTAGGQEMALIEQWNDTAWTIAAS